MRLGRHHRALDQFKRCGPIHSHAALCGIHRFGQMQALIPQADAKPQGRVPIHRSAGIPRAAFAQRVRHHMRRRKRRAGQRNAGRAGRQRCAGQAVRFQCGVGGGKQQHGLGHLG